MAKREKPGIENASRPFEINEMKTRQDSELVPTRASQSFFPKGEERKAKRRRSLKTLDGVLRESAKVYRLLVLGEISMAEAEVRSRILRRHSEILDTIEKNAILEDMQGKLAAIQEAQGLPAFDARQLTDLTGDEASKP